MPQFTTARAESSTREFAPPAREETAPDESDLSNVATSSLRLFLVEDSKLYRERVAEHLAFACGTRLVGWADTEHDAIEALKAGGWDVLIVDLQLRHGTGIGVLQALRGLRRPPESKVIMLTDHDFYLYRRKAIELGADFFCVKGRDFDLVVQLLRELSRHGSDGHGEGH
jgi:DNA-binding NarL/FixJ family response regulator